MKKSDNNTIQTQIQYKMLEELTEMNRKLQEEIEVRKESEKALKESEQKYRQIIEEGSDIIYRVDAKGNFTYVNQVTLKVVGMKEKELIGKHFSLLIRDDYKKKAQKFYKNVLDKRIHSSYWEFPLGIDSDKELWIGQNVTLLVDGDKITCIQAVARDITERIEYQRELISAKEIAEEAAKTKSQFLANMSHEIRTPMNGIMGLTNLLLNTVLTDKQQDYLNAIITSSDTLMVIINDILDISKIDAGKLIIEKRNFKAKDVISSIIEIFSSKAVEKGLLLSLDIDKTLPDVLIGDVARLNQILYNILGNAIKFTKDGEVRLVVKAKQKNDSKIAVKFVISDTGVGISQSKLKSIFSAFTQANGDTTRKFGGTGLGLTIVKKLVELQHGNITVESVPGKGSVFTIVLDYEIGENIPVKKLDKNCDNCADIACLNNLNILLVEDNLVNQMVTNDLLSEKSSIVKIANNGEEAIAMVSSEKFDIILMDMQMPVMDGYQAMTYIRNEMESDKKNIPILALTAHAIEGEVEKCKNAGADDYLAKPFNPMTLFSKIIELIEKSKCQMSN